MTSVGRSCGQALGAAPVGGNGAHARGSAEHSPPSMLRVEIQTAPHGLAYLETYVAGRLAYRSTAMAVAAARGLASQRPAEVVDHTRPGVAS